MIKVISIIYAILLFVSITHVESFINYHTQIIQTPETPQKGQSYTLTCQVTPSLADASFKWFKNGELVGHQAQLVIDRYEPSEENIQYRCKVKGTSNSDTRVKLKRTFRWREMHYENLVSLKIKRTPEHVNYGQNLHLECMLNDPNRNVEYSWYKNNNFLKSGQTLLLNNFGLKDTGDYKCHVKGIGQNDKFIDLTAFVNYTSQGPVDHESFLYKISIKPSDPHVTIGSKLELNCVVTPTPEHVTYQWTKNGLPMHTEANLKFKSFEETDLASYTCEAKITDSNSVVSTLSASLDYSSKVLKSSLLRSKYHLTLSTIPKYAEIGERFQLKCSVEPFVEDLVYRLFRNKVLIANGPEHTIDSFSSNDLGVYRCEARSKESAHPYINAWVEINYLAIPQPTGIYHVVTIDQSPKTIVSGDKISFKCLVTPSLDSVTYEWYADEKLMTRNSELIIPSFSFKDLVSYRCVVEINKIKQQTYVDYSSALIKVPEKKYSLSLFTMNHNIKKGDRVTLEARIHPEPENVKYSWYKNSLFVQHGKELVIESFNIYNLESYKFVMISRNEHTPFVHQWAIKDFSSMILIQPTKMFHFTIDNLQYHPQNGQLVKLRYSVSPQPSMVTFRWYKNGNYAGSGPVYSIHNFQTNDNAEYKIVMISNAENKPFIHQWATKRFNSQNYQIDLQTEPYGATYGHQLKISCIIKPNIQSLSYKWYKDGKYVSDGAEYIIPKYGINDIASYMCVAKSEPGSNKKVHMKMYIDFSSIRIKQSQYRYRTWITLPKHIKKGDNVTLAAYIYPNPVNIRYGWYKNGLFVGDQKKLNISNFGIDNLRSYKFVMVSKNDNDTFVHQWITKDFSSMRINENSNQNINMSITTSKERIKEGDDLTLTLNTSPQPHNILIAWYKDGNFLVFGPVHHIKNFTICDIAVYKVVIISTVDDKNFIHQWDIQDYTSTLIKPTSNHSFHVYIETTNMNVEKGEIVRLTGITKPYIENIRYAWYKDGELVSRYGMLVIDKFGIRDLKSYKVLVISKNAEMQYIHSWAIIDYSSTMLQTPINKYQVVIQGSNSSIRHGETITLRALITPNPINVKFAWYRNGEYISNSQQITITNFNSENLASYKFVMISNQNNGSYIHEVKSKDFTTINIESNRPTQKVKLSIKTTPKSILNGYPLTLRCVIDGEYDEYLSYNWFKNGQFIASGQKFKIESFCKKDDGTYKCVVTSQGLSKYFVHQWASINTETIAREIKPINLDIQLMIVTKPKIIKIGQPAEMNCEFTINGASRPYRKIFKLKWIKNGIDFKTGRKLKFKSFNECDNGEYVCALITPTSNASASIFVFKTKK